MNGVYKLQNEIMHYDWGSTEYIPELLGIVNTDNKPYAEVWMGTHPLGESYAVLGKDKKPLSMISGSLPFLFKLLAAGKILSIQVHPNKAQAEAGFVKENAKNIPLDAPLRNYKDENHKPEILCALTPFRALCGFREIGAIKQMLSVFSCPAVKKLCQIFDNGAAEDDTLRFFLHTLSGLSKHERVEISEYIKKNIQNIKHIHKDYVSELELIEYLENIFPGDPSVLAPFYLNVVDLSSGEAIFLPAGILHAYVHGMGIELMAASDNVIRGGLTAKHIDHDELFNILKFVPFKPDLYKPADVNFYTYPAPADDFTLYYINNEGCETDFPVSRASIFICVKGSACFCFKDAEKLDIQQGESVFITENACNNFRLSGIFKAYIADGPARKGAKIQGRRNCGV